MTEVGIRALKQNASQVVAVAAAGQSVTITDRGRPVARLVPIRGSRLEQLTSEGRLRSPLRPLAELPEPVAITGTDSLSEALVRLRDDERY